MLRWFWLPRAEIRRSTNATRSHKAMRKISSSPLPSRGYYRQTRAGENDRPVYHQPWNLHSFKHPYPCIRQSSLNEETVILPLVSIHKADNAILDGDRGPLCKRSSTLRVYTRRLLTNLLPSFPQRFNRDNATEVNNGI